MNVTDALAARERIDERMKMREFRATVAQSFPPMPSHCNNPSGFHMVTADNPMATGRCLACRAFVVWTPRHGWRSASAAQARAWAKFGVRRHASSHDPTSDTASADV